MPDPQRVACHESRRPTPSCVVHGGRTAGSVTGLNAALSAASISGRCG